MSYTVKEGDTLSGLAKKNNTTTKKLLAANPSIKNANQIKTGQKINIPLEAGKSPYTVKDGKHVLKDMYAPKVEHNYMGSKIKNSKYYAKGGTVFTGR